MPMMAGHRSLPRTRRLPPCSWVGHGRARGAARRWPTARSRRSRRPRVAPPRLDVRAAADTRHRRRGRLVAVGGPPGGRRPPANPVPRRRTVAFLGRDDRAGLRPAVGHRPLRHALFSVHMVQHVLLMLVAAPLLALAAPMTLVLRVSSPTTRRRWVLPVLHSRVDALPGPPGHRLADVRGDDVGGPLLAAVQRVARGPVPPRPRARHVPDRRAVVLVAGGRPGSRRRSG